ncbi:hypothetical protein FGO68_gene16216 [Halteria grandinella]|uniref:Uncharacterized protein n=1 Tax=Halteria grandinella TaxID=5974 RepID=A0A8J8SVQ2_HALGN|nr:hypothetical protein FGO68_gene16216 [Halteria grandinella]
MRNQLLPLPLNATHMMNSIIMHAKKIGTSSIQVNRRHMDRRHMNRRLKNRHHKGLRSLGSYQHILLYAL